MSTAKTDKRKSVFLTCVFQQIIDSLALTIALAALMCCAGSVSVYAALGNMMGVSENLIQIAVSAAGEGSSTFVVLFYALAILIVIRNFGHLHKKSMVDTLYSLPVNKNQRYISACISSVASVVVATLISICVTMVIFYTMSSADEAFVKIINSGKYSYGDFLGVFFHEQMFILADMLLFTSFAVLAICCCGKVFDSIVCAGILAIAPMTLYSLISEIVYCDMSFIWQKGNSVVSSFAYITPVIPLDPDVYGEIADPGTGFSMSNYPKFYLVVFAVSLIFFTISFFAHKLRKAEDVGQPIAVRAMYYLVLVLVMSVFAATIWYNKEYEYGYEQHKIMLTYFFIMIAVFVALEALSARGNRLSMERVKNSVIRFVIIVPACFALIWAMVKISALSNFNVPDINDVDYISINSSTHLMGCQCKYGDNGEVIAIVDPNGNKISDGELMNCDRRDMTCYFNKDEQIRDIMEFADTVVETEKEYYLKGETLWKSDYVGEYRIYMYMNIYLKNGDRYMLEVENWQVFIDNWMRYYITDDLFDEYADYYDEGEDDYFALTYPVASNNSDDWCLTE